MADVVAARHLPLEEFMATRILSCLIALAFVFSSTGPMLAAQPSQPQRARDGVTPRLLAVPPAPPASSADAAPAADASIAALQAQATSVAASYGHNLCAYERWWGPVLEVQHLRPTARQPFFGRPIYLRARCRG